MPNYLSIYLPIYLSVYIYVCLSICHLGLRGPQQRHVELIDVAQLARVVETRLVAAVRTVSTQ